MYTYHIAERAEGQSKSTNGFDDILQLTESRKHRVQQIHSGNDIHFGLKGNILEIDEPADFLYQLLDFQQTS
ncbi:36695_t:CDS:2 [Gigaspora margarita]|uniref:36695_t:CDS:1 n=1 Tax=Gigaspora margarita TaxID=4874 RepID=A0ABN7W994_GIGMA|nr:36695_t:CDS:2 [Gigaspora margarita]